MQNELDTGYWIEYQVVFVQILCDFITCIVVLNQ
jgi:hypothetical protein